MIGTKVVLVCVSFVIAGCVQTTEDTTPKSKPVETTQPAAKPVAHEAKTKATIASLPAIPAGKARLIVYRSSYMGFAIQPKVFVDGQETGRCKPGTTIAANLTPGEHTIASTTEVKRTLSVNLIAGKTTYVSCRTKMGIAVGRAKFEQVSPAKAIAKAASMRLQGVF